jgi:hypothetical protein
MWQIQNFFPQNLGGLWWRIVFPQKSLVFVFVTVVQKFANVKKRTIGEESGLITTMFVFSTKFSRRGDKKKFKCDLYKGCFVEYFCKSRHILRKNSQKLGSWRLPEQSVILNISYFLA